MKHLLVLRVVIETHYGHSVVQLERKRVYTVIDQDNITEASLVENAQIFNVKVGITRPNTARTEVPSLDQGAIGIKIINDRVCVLLFGGGEDYDLEVLVGGLEALAGEWPNVDAGEDGFGLLGELDGDDDFWIVRLHVVHAVNQGLVQVEDHRFGLRRVVRRRQIDQQVLYLLKRRHSQPSRPDIE